MRRVVIVACLSVLVALVPAAAGGKDAGKAEKQIRKADLELARAVETRDIELFKSLIQDDARFYGSGGEYKGPEGVAAAWAPLFAGDRESKLLWEPYQVEAAGAGDPGYSVGFHEVRKLKDPEASTFGRYPTVWARDAEGKWMAKVDIGTPPGSVKRETARGEIKKP